MDHAGQANSFWDRIECLARETAINRRKSLEPPKQNNSRHWTEYNKYSALANMLSIAVSHKDRELRKAYIERIMTLSSRTQHLLMAMIERRKQSNSRNKTPSKHQKLRSRSSSIKKLKNKKSVNSRVQPSTDKSKNGTPIETQRLNSSPNGYPKSASSIKNMAGQSMVGNNAKQESAVESYGGVSSSKDTQINKTLDNSESTSSFLRRAPIKSFSPEIGNITRRSFRDAFGSPLQQPLSKKIPPSSSERASAKNNKIQSNYRMFSPGLGDTAEFESQVQELRDENGELSRELERIRQKEGDLTKKIDDIEEHYRKEMLTVEREARERDDNTKRECQRHISKIQSELVKVTEECSNFQNERDQLVKIKEEMEVMSRNKVLLEETTERLRTYKEKVQQFTDVKDALQREEKAHSRSVEENLRLQNELKNLQPLKRQLEVYKSRAVDTEVQLTDCQDELTKLKEQKTASCDVDNQREQYVIAQKEEIKELLGRVQQNDAANKEGPGVGDGISELNPELKAEILSLRNENSQLRAFAEKRQDDAVTKLEQNSEDKSMLAERFKVQFLSTKDKLESTEISFADSRNREAKLQEEVHDKTKLAERYKSQFMSTKAQLESTQQSLQESKEREGSLRKELADSLSRIKEKQNEVEDLSKHLSKCTENYNKAMTRETQLERELASWTGEARDLQQKSSDLSRKLTKTVDELEDSQRKENTLLLEVSNLKKHIHVLQERCNGLADELQNNTDELKRSRCRETRLETSVKEWTERAQQSHEHSKSLSLDLCQCTNDLKESTDYAARLEVELSTTSELKQEAEDEIDKLTNKLSETTSSLERTCQSLDQSMQRYLDLQNDLTDMTCRAEDSERVSKQRMELVQTTREELETARQNIDDLIEKKEELTLSVEKWISETDQARNLAKILGSELDEMHRSLEDMEDKLSVAKSTINALNKEKELLTTSVAKWTSETDEAKYLAKNLKRELDATLSSLNDTKTKNAEELEEIQKLAHENLLVTQNDIQRLENKLYQTEEDLRSTEESAKALEARERLTNDQLRHAEEAVSELEISAEKNVKAREELLNCTENLQIENSTMKAEFEAREQKLEKSLESGKKIEIKLKQELSATKDAMNNVQVSFSSSQHREKMLKHEVAKLQDKNEESKNELSTLKSNMDNALEQSSKSLESVREIMNTKAKKELEDLQRNMNQLLDDEQKAKRRLDVMYKEQISRLNQQYNKEILTLKENTNCNHAKYSEGKDLEIQYLRKEYEEKLSSIECAANGENEKLMTRGKEMLKDVKEEKDEQIRGLSDDIDFLENKIQREEQDKKRLGTQFQTKIVEYKKKLQVASSRINTLSADNNDYEDRVKILERERFKLNNENDRYRRQIGGRSDSAIQSQLDLLQTEFQNIVDENRELRRKMHGQGCPSLSSISEEGQTRPYTRNRANQSTLLQLRAEYEESIESLNDEKRELIMKNSAAITDVQKAEKRAWETDQENAKLKQSLTSLKLSNERMETHLKEGGGNVADHNSSFHDMSVSDDFPIPKPPPSFEDELPSEIRSSQKNNRSRNISVLESNQAYTNTALDSRSSNYGLTSPDVQKTTLHTPYRNRPER